MSSMRESTAWATVTSSPLKGSSAMSSRGAARRAAASIALWASPRLNSCENDRYLNLLGNRTSPRESSTRARISSAGKERCSSSTSPDWVPIR
jgi:hypothetical protein